MDSSLWDAQPGWLDTASYGLPPRHAFEALQAALDDWRVGRTTWQVWDGSTQRARASYARLVGVDVDDVCVGAQVSQILAPIAAAVAGRRVLVPDVEFTSNVFPWLAAGCDLRAVEVAKLADVIDGDTDVVAFSLVQSATGEVADYGRIVEAARAHGALVVVDATQACGWLPFDGSLADAVVVSAYKWLMSPRGSAFGYLAPALRERMTPYAAGWYAAADDAAYYGPRMRLADNARRFDISPAWQVYEGTAPALELVEELGVEAIHAHDVRLANRFLTGLGQPSGDSAIVTVDVPGAEEKLERAGIRAAVRAGRVRASFHAYTTDADVDAALNALG